MKKTVKVIISVVIIAAAALVAPKVVDRCDDCDRMFVGAGYEPNVIEDYLAEEDQIICESCAREQHKIALTLGKELDEFKRDLFE